MKSKARKTTWQLFTQTILSPTCLLGESLSTLALIVDSGASVCISPCREDFVTYKPSKVKIKDLSKLNKIDGEGLIRWKVRDKLHFPNAGVRLLSPQILLTTVGGQAVQTTTDLQTISTMKSVSLQDTVHTAIYHFYPVVNMLLAASEAMPSTSQIVQHFLLQSIKVW